MSGDDKFNQNKDADKDHQNGVDGPFKTADEESEPCLEEKNKGRMFWDNTERKLLEKSGLTKKGLYYVAGILLAALLLLIVVIVLASLWPTTPHQHRFPVCNSDSCLRASTQMRQYMNETVSRCDDVETWACGGWLNGNTLPSERSKWNRREEIEVQEAVRVRELISTLSLPLSRGSVEWKLKYFYEACVEVDAVNTDAARPLTTIISELGGWHILKQWSSDYFNFDVLLQELHVKYGVSPYFKITTVPNSREPGNSSIMILPSGLGLPDKSYYYMEDDKYEKAYEQLIKDVILQLSQTVTEAERFARNIFSYEKRLAEIMPDSAELLDPINTDNPVKVSGLKILVQNIQLDNILAAMYPDANINEETEVIVAQPEYLAKLTQIISSTDATTKNGYMIWTLVREYIPYLSSNFQDAVQLYRSEVYGVKKPIERWEFCSNLVQRFMPVAIDAIIEKQRPIKDAKVVVNEMFTNIVGSVKQHLQKYKANSDLYSKLEKKLVSIKLQVGLPEIAFNDTLIRNYYIKLNIIRSNLFENYKRAIIFVKKLEDHKLREGSMDGYVMDAATKKPASVSYNPSSNTVVVPRALLTSPYFEPGYSKSINYGRLGHEIAKAVVSSVLPYDSAWTADSKLLSRFHLSVNESLRLIQYPTHCLSEFISKRHYVPKEFSNLTALNTFKYLSALNIAHDSLKTSLENTEHVHLPTLEIYEDSALFYLANMQELCTISTKEQNLYDTLVNYKLPENNMFQVNLHQSFGLWDSLKCSYSDKYECSDIF